MDKTNVIVVDWGKLVPLPCYPSAAINTRQAAHCTADFLIKLRAFYGKGFKLRKLHAIGFSLGAHVVGMASNAVRDKFNVQFQRITGDFQIFELLDNIWCLYNILKHF